MPRRDDAGGAAQRPEASPAAVRKRSDPLSVARLSTAERRDLAEAAADLARRRLAPLAPELDRGEGAAFDECWAGVRELGLERALLADELGGAGLAPGDILAPLEALA
ncbi:MAG: hypothetical protein GEU88_18575 [Solirubrobacterales bacterium]|nr:hypothetical protein [Solirubrobacterales bacterium]